MILTIGSVVELEPHSARVYAVLGSGLTNVQISIVLRGESRTKKNASPSYRPASLSYRPALPTCLTDLPYRPALPSSSSSNLPNDHGRFDEV